MNDLLSSAMLLLMLLNPFLVTVYLIDIIQKLDSWKFNRVLLRAGLIATVVFWGFAILGDSLFTTVMQVHFASFLMFGGLVFLIIGLQFVFQGPQAIEMLRGESQHIAGAIAMPVLIGPGTISASVVIGERLSPMIACLVILGTILVCLVMIIVLKSVHDWVRPKNEPLVERYFEITGRISALYIGTVAVEMVMKGIFGWVDAMA